LGAEPSRCRVPREKREQKTEDFIVYLYVMWNMPVKPSQELVALYQVGLVRPGRCLSSCRG